MVAALALVTEKSCRPLTVTLRPVPSVLAVTISAQEALLKGSGQSGGLDRNLSGTLFALKRNPDAEEEWAELELSLSQTFPAAVHPRDFSCFPAPRTPGTKAQPSALGRQEAAELSHVSGETWAQSLLAVLLLIRPLGP